MVQREPAGNLNLGSWFTVNGSGCTVSSLRFSLIVLISEVLNACKAGGTLTLLGLGIESELSLLSLSATVRVMS